MPRMTPSGNWLRLDERSNALDNLCMCDYFLATLPDPIRWKWAIMAMHQALYGFAVAAVQGTDARRVLRRPEDAESHLISIWTAVKRAKDPANLWSGTNPLVTSDAEWQALERLVDEFRNGFEHFGVKGWSIEVSGMPTLLLHALRILEGVALGASSPHNWGSKERTQLTDAITRLRGRLVAVPIA